MMVTGLMDSEYYSGIFQNAKYFSGIAAPDDTVAVTLFVNMAYRASLDTALYHPFVISDTAGTVWGSTKLFEMRYKAMLKIGKVRCEYKKNPVGIDVLAPRLSWQLHSKLRGVMQTAYHIQVSKRTDSFEGALVWDTGKVESEQSIHIEYNGETLETRTRYYYRIRIWDNKGNISEWSETAFWEMGLLKPEEWVANWITHDTETDPLKPGPCPYLRTTFNVNGKIKAVRIFATSLGLYELHINGIRVGDCLFAPGWTSYNKRLQYQAYDVTGLVTSGRNAVGVILGDGWYKGYLGWAGERNTYGDKTAALIQMHIEYEDGRRETVISGSDWKATTGPILMSDIYHGETYDARLEMDGWNTAGYDDVNWSSASVLEQSKKILVAQENMPVRIIDKIKPVALINCPDGDLILDMGQNMVGWLRFRLRGMKGDEVRLEHAEVLDRDGNLYIENLRGAKQTIQYTLKGREVEEFEPHFTFQGFRYVKLYGFTEKPALDDFIGMVIHSDLESTGNFRCSNDLINQLQHNILWSQKGNFLDVPTDCPQRNERLGWTGDAQLFSRTACFIMNAAPFFTKWLRDLKADQSEERGVPFVIPDIWKGEYKLGNWKYPSALWGDAAVICPWNIYLCYGDKRILEQQYESMKSWVEYIRKEGENEYLWNTGFHFGDWLALDAKDGSFTGSTAKEYIATAFYAYSTRLLKNIAEILKKDNDVITYNGLYTKIIENFREEFVTPNGRLAVSTQTAHVLALMFDLIEEKDRKKVLSTLVRDLEESKYHLTTGLAGTPYLCHVLSENGYTDIAYKLLLQKDFPSWLYQITKGATTIWEHWDGIKEDGSFWSKNMNSFNHYVYGAIGDWLYRVVAGIDTDNEMPGYKHIYIKPQPGQGIEFAEAQLQSMYGEIKSNWKKTEDGMELAVVIPPNTVATAVLPGASPSKVLESGKKFNDAEGIIEYEQTDKGMKLELGSGEYCFSYKLLEGGL